jgi:hypothetical protein
MKKIKATEIVLFVCLAMACLLVPRFIISQLLSVVGHMVYNPYLKSYLAEPKFPEGGWLEQVIRIGLIGLTVLYAFRVAKRIKRESLSVGGTDKEK